MYVIYVFAKMYIHIMGTGWCQNTCIFLLSMHRSSFSLMDALPQYADFIPICFPFSLGVMKLEATKFRPRQVVKHVLQTAAASLQKILTLEGHVADDVPIEVRT